MRVFDWFFSCHHRRLSRIMTIGDQTFQVCLSCGYRVPYCWETMSRVDERHPAGRARQSPLPAERAGVGRMAPLA